MACRSPDPARRPPRWEPWRTDGRGPVCLAGGQECQHRGLWRSLLARIRRNALVARRFTARHRQSALAGGPGWWSSSQRADRHSWGTTFPVNPKNSQQSFKHNRIAAELVGSQSGLAAPIGGNPPGGGANPLRGVAAGMGCPSAAGLRGGCSRAPAWTAATGRPRRSNPAVTTASTTTYRERRTSGRGVQGDRVAADFSDRPSTRLT